MQLMNRLAGGAAIAVLALASASAVYAQETTGSIRGRITDETGAPIANATVVVRHDPSGTSSTVMSNAEGSFNTRGLRVGGPYTVTASAPNLEAGKLTIPAIGIGEAGEADIVLYSANAVEELVVTAAPTDRSSTQQGLGSRYGSATIEVLPSATRDPKEFARLNPFATLEVSNSDALIIAGTNPKYNSLTVDGVTQNDDFGLNTSGYPTQRSPISVDALESLEVNVAPYSVEYNKFTGGNLNAVTKSGTNSFRGSLFYEFSDEGMAATRQKNRFGTFSNTNPFETKTWGGTLGGPIIQDRLFFFVSYEKTEATNPLTHGPASLGRPITPGNATAADITTIQNTLDTLYDFDFDVNNSTLDSGVFLEEDEKWLAKVDFNITDDQRLVFNYQLTEGNRVSVGDAASAGGTYPFASNFYNKGERLETYGLQLFSNWTQDFTTELTWNRKEVLTEQDPLAGCDLGPQGNGDEECEFAQVEIFAGTTTVFAGPDRSRHANELENSLETWGAKAEYTLGNHTLLAGWLREDYTAMNLFGSQAEARVTFASLADFQIGRASRIRYQMAFRDANGDGFKNEEDARINVDYLLNSLYFQDTWEVTPDLTLLAGVRYETYGGDLRPNKNINFKNRYGFDNDRTLDGMDIWLPRFSFDWRPEEGLKITGGIGLFSGGSPNVWVANSFSNDGTTLTTLDCSRTGTATAACPQYVKDYLNNVLAGGEDLYDLPLAVEQFFTGVNINSAAVVTAPTNAIAPNFEIPSSWKASLSIDKTMDFGESDWATNWNFGVDVLLTEVNKGITWLDYRAGTTPCNVAPDGRPVYLGSGLCKFGNLPVNVDRVGGSTNQDLILANTEDGHNYALAFRFAKSFEWGLSARGSYTRTDAEDVNPGLSSVAFSNWSNNATSDVNGLTAGRSSYEIKDSFKLDLSWKKKFFGDNYTRVSMFAEYRSGYPYSLVFNTSGTSCTATGFNGGNCMFGDTSSATSTFNRQLLYIPTLSDPLMRFEGAATEALMTAFINNNDLGQYRGSILPKNSQTSDWVTRIDLRLSQEFPAFFPTGAKLEGFLDIKNLANLLNDEWGVQEQVEFPYMAAPVTARIESCASLPVGAPACAVGQSSRYVVTGVGTVPFDTANSTAARRSSWQMKIGVRYKF